MSPSSPQTNPITYHHYDLHDIRPVVTSEHNKHRQGGLPSRLKIEADICRAPIVAREQLQPRHGEHEDEQQRHEEKGHGSGQAPCQNH